MQKLDERWLYWRGPYTSKKKTYSSLLFIEQATEWASTAIILFKTCANDCCIYIETRLVLLFGCLHFSLRQRYFPTSIAPCTEKMHNWKYSLEIIHFGLFIVHVFEKPIRFYGWNRIQIARALIKINFFWLHSIRISVVRQEKSSAWESKTYSRSHSHSHLRSPANEQIDYAPRLFDLQTAEKKHANSKQQCAK